MRILISGSHGLVGSALTKSLQSQGHEVLALVRLEGFDSVSHLAGESIAAGRWTEAKKKAIRDSRVRGTQLLSETLASLRRRPKSFLCASAIGFYGNRGDEILSETNAPGHDFLATVCVEWEKASAGAAENGIRTVNLRFGVILNAQGGALAKMLPPFRMGIGGKVGSGKQWMSWIALDDAVTAIEFVLSNETLNGPINLVTPNAVSNAEFTSTLGRVLGRPTLFPIPAFGARLAFGEMADALLLASQRVHPTRLLEAGYAFHYPELPGALSHILRQ